MKNRILWAAALLLTAFATRAYTIGHVEVDFYSDDVVKITNLAPGEKAHVSRSVVATPANDLKITRLTTGETEILVSESGTIVAVGKKSGAVTITSGDLRAVFDPGLRETKDGRRILSLSTVGDGSFYGAGERGYSYNLKGDTLVMYNKQNYGYTAGEERIKQMNITMPLFLSSEGYGILFDDYAAAEMVLADPIEYITESPDPVSYYFIGGGSLEKVVENYTSLTGRQELPPFWALGYITSKYGYKTQRETVGVIDTLKRRGYPVDGIVLDLYWYGKEQDMGRLDWDKEQWPDHRKMLADLKKEGVNLVAISQPYILRNGRGLDNYNYLKDRGMMVKDSTGGPQEVKIWVGEGGMFDVSNPETRRWLADRYQSLTDGGITGWWGDLGEPEVHPETGLHANGLTARQYHNQYGNDWSEIIYDLFKEKYPRERLMTMMRGGTAGLQRYSVYPWSTDVSRSWGGLKPQVTIMLNSGLSGLGYMSHDVGGFAIDPERPTDPELYVRWLQLGTFSPILRTHAQQVAEPYHYTDVEPTLKRFIKERYRWLPYNYTAAAQNARTGAPLVRPLNYYSGTSKYDDIEDEYLWGDNVLVAPVLEQGATSRRVVLPDDGRATRWVDLNNPTRSYLAGDTIQYDAPLEVLPLFARAGAVIPTADYTMENTGDYRRDRYTLNYYSVPGTPETYSYLYEDDLATPQPTEWLSVEMKAWTTPMGKINISLTPEEGHKGYPGMPAVKEITFKIYNVHSKPFELTLNGKDVAKKAWKYDAKTSTLTITTKWNAAEPLILNATTELN